MNGRPLPLAGAEMKAMLSYLKFLSTGIAVGTQVEGAGTLKLKLLARAADPAAGAKVYAGTCVACHGDKGQGQRRGKAGDGDGYLFPPLWGPDSNNNGAGMARITLAAGFIKGNMPADFPARKNKLVDAAFAPYTPGLSAEQHKYGPWQPILEARQKGAAPPL